MVKVYPDGDSFYQDNESFINKNENIAAFFRLDAPLLHQSNSIEYALKFYDAAHSLIILCVRPYNLLIHGDQELIREAIKYLITNGYLIKDYMCEASLGEAIMQELIARGFNVSNKLSMDFLETNQKVEINSTGIEKATDADLDEIYQLVGNFIKDCGLNDKIDKDQIKKIINSFYLIKQDGKIISMARISDWTNSIKKISYVYTVNQYRGQGYAKRVVASCLNEIINQGFIAGLNVDRKNPISYHLYTSLGFKKEFSQGIYQVKITK